MSNTDLPRISGSKETLLSPGHWFLLAGAVLTIAAVLGLTATSRPVVPVANRGELAVQSSAP